jgi:hypothetical protein
MGAERRLDDRRYGRLKTASRNAGCDHFPHSGRHVPERGGYWTLHWVEASDLIEFAVGCLSAKFEAPATVPVWIGPESRTNQAHENCPVGHRGRGNPHFSNRQQGRKRVAGLTRAGVQPYRVAESMPVPVHCSDRGRRG